MKKTFDQKWGTKILIATVLFIASYTFTPISSAGDLWENYWDVMQNGYFSRLYYENMVDDQFTEAGYDVSSLDDEAERSPNWDNVFDKDTKENGQNLYLLVYNKIKKEPTDAALEQTALYFGYDDDLLLDIIDGDIYNLWQYDASVAEYDVDHNLDSIEGITSKYTAVIDYYDEQLSYELMQSELTTKALIQEMFANGDTEDSGFDLIVDLQIIEVILFGDVSTYGEDGGGGGSEDGDEEEEAEEEEEESVSEATEEDVSEEEEEEGVTDRAECFEDMDLSGALADLLAEEGGDGEGGAGDGDGEDGGGGGGDDSDEDDDGSPAADAIGALAAGDWGRDVPCTEFICIEVNFIDEDDEPQYEETTNCIDCHFTFILETIQEVTSHSLTPGKVPGNIFEDATCKEAAAHMPLSINVFLISSPILTPPNDDIIVDLGSFGQDFMAALMPGRSEEADPEDPTYGLSESDLNTQYLASVKGDTLTNLAEFSETIVDMTMEGFMSEVEALQESELSSKMQDMTTMYQTLATEMLTMNMTFTSIEMILWDTLDYLGELKDKPYQK